MHNNINIRNGGNMKSCINIFYQLTVRDKQGKIVSKTPISRSKSFVVGFLKILQSQLTGLATTVKATDASSQACAATSSNLAMFSPASTTTWGILLGIGSTPPDNLDYVMETLIADGNGAGQLEYAAHGAIDAQEVGANVDLQLSRTMQNLSGGGINVTEAGIVTYFGASKFGMIIHDIFAVVAVANGETITVTYTIRTTV